MKGILFQSLTGPPFVSGKDFSVSVWSRYFSTFAGRGSFLSVGIECHRFFSVLLRQ